MHVVDFFLALNGDLNNQTPLFGVTIAELEVLRMIHGGSSVHGVKLVGTSDVAMEDEYRRLLSAYPHKYNDLIRGYWRDNGAKFPRDIREIRLSESELAMPLHMQTENIKPSAKKQTRSKEELVREVLDEAL